MATVRNRAGQLVGALRKEDFEIYDNGVRQEIAVFERQTEQPLSVALLIDVSGSTAKDLKYETDSAARFLRALLPKAIREDQVALYSLRRQVTAGSRTSPTITPCWKRSLKRIHGSAGTSLYDAIWLAAHRGSGDARGPQGDGDCQRRRKTPPAPKTRTRRWQAAQMADAVIYPVVVMPITNDAGRNIGGENALTFMAQGTGGRHVLSRPRRGSSTGHSPTSSPNCAPQYLLGFYPHDVPLTKDRFHKLEVRVKPPGIAGIGAQRLLWGAEGFSGSPGRSRFR